MRCLDLENWDTGNATTDMVELFSKKVGVMWIVRGVLTMRITTLTRTLMTGMFMERPIWKTCSLVNFNYPLDKWDLRKVKT